MKRVQILLVDAKILNEALLAVELADFEDGI
jgi:hypothetical protein